MPKLMLVHNIYSHNHCVKKVTETCLLCDHSEIVNCRNEIKHIYTEASSKYKFYCDEHHQEIKSKRDIANAYYESSLSKEQNDKGDE